MPEFYKSPTVPLTPNYSASDFDSKLLQGILDSEIKAQEDDFKRYEKGVAALGTVVDQVLGVPFDNDIQRSSWERILQDSGVTKEALLNIDPMDPMGAVVLNGKIKKAISSPEMQKIVREKEAAKILYDKAPTYQFGHPELRKKFIDGLERYQKIGDVSPFDLNFEDYTYKDYDNEINTDLLKLKDIITEKLVHDPNGWTYVEQSKQLGENRIKTVMERWTQDPRTLNSLEADGLIDGDTKTLTDAGKAYIAKKINDWNQVSTEISDLKAPEKVKDEKEKKANVKPYGPDAEIDYDTGMMTVDGEEQLPIPLDDKGKPDMSQVEDVYRQGKTNILKRALDSGLEGEDLSKLFTGSVVQSPGELQVTDIKGKVRSLDGTDLSKEDYNTIVKDPLGPNIFGANEFAPTQFNNFKATSVTKGSGTVKGFDGKPQQVNGYWVEGSAYTNASEFAFGLPSLKNGEGSFYSNYRTIDDAASDYKNELNGKIDPEGNVKVKVRKFIPETEIYNQLGPNYNSTFGVGDLNSASSGGDEVYNSIAQKESGGDYNAYNFGSAGDTPGNPLNLNFSGMTLGQIEKTTNANGRAINAAGKYQFRVNDGSSNHLVENASRLGYDADTKFTQSVQEDLMRNYYLYNKRKSVRDFIINPEPSKKDLVSAAADLRKEFPSIGSTKEAMEYLKSLRVEHLNKYNSAYSQVASKPLQITQENLPKLPGTQMPIIGVTGDTGDGTGPHIHIQKAGGGDVPESLLTAIGVVGADGKAKMLKDLTLSGEHGEDRGDHTHQGKDYAIGKGRYIVSSGKVKSVELKHDKAGPGAGGGFYTEVVVNVNGVDHKIWIMHQDPISLDVLKGNVEQESSVQTSTPDNADANNSGSEKKGAMDRALKGK